MGTMLRRQSVKLNGRFYLIFTILPNYFSCHLILKRNQGKRALLPGVFLLIGVEPEPFELGEHLIDASGKLSIYCKYYIKYILCTCNIYLTITAWLSCHFYCFFVWHFSLSYTCAAKQNHKPVLLSVWEGLLWTLYKYLFIHVLYLTCCV